MVEADDEFNWLFRAEYPIVLRTVTLLLGDRGRAEEITQDAFAALFSHWSKVSRYERPDAWVRRVAVRMAVRLSRRERARASLEWRASPRKAVELAVVDVDLQHAMSQLPIRQRIAILLFYFEDRPVSEIADILELSPAATKVLLHRSRRRLGQLLGEREVSSDVV